MPRLNPRRLAWQATVATASLALATIAVAVLQDRFNVPNPSSVYLVAVVATAFVAGSIGAIIVSLASFLLYNVLFVEPRHTFIVAEPGEWVAVLLLLFVGVVVGQLAALQRTRAEQAHDREREARALFRLSRALATRESTPSALADIVDVLRAETGMEQVSVALGPDDAAERVAASTQPGDRRAMPGRHQVLRRTPGDEPAQWIRIHLPAARPRGTGPLHPPAEAAARSDAYRVRIEASGSPLGSIWSLRERSADAPTGTETRLLAAAADQIGQALGHDRLVAERQATEIAREGDAVKSALLQSVSHDLRTPLATIRAAAGSLRPGSGLTEDELRESAAAIDREVEYLNRIVTNLLDLSRIEAGALRAERDVFELDELVQATIDRLRPRLASRVIEVDVTHRAVWVDPVFLDAALTNVIENTIKYAPPDAPIRVRTAESNERVTLTIEDGGAGVPDDALPKLFEKFYRVPEARRSSRAGTGIGLAVVRGLLEATGARAVARRSELGGLAIDLEIPSAPATKPESPAEPDPAAAGRA